MLRSFLVEVIQSIPGVLALLEETGEGACIIVAAGGGFREWYYALQISTELSLKITSGTQLLAYGPE